MVGFVARSLTLLFHSLLHVFHVFCGAGGQQAVEGGELCDQLPGGGAEAQDESGGYVVL